MGTTPTVLCPEDLNRLKTETDLKEKDIKRIHKKYGALDKEKKGFVTVDDLANIPEIEQNPLRYRIGQCLSNQEQNESVSFEAFIKIIDVFKNNKLGDQYKFIYNLFDYDKDGKISSEDMLINFKLLLGNSLNAEQIKEIIEKTIVEYSSDQKYIYYDDFLKILNEA